MLKPHNELYRDLLVSGKDLSKEDCKILFRINILQETGTPKKLRDAAELSMTNPNTLSFGTVLLKDRIQFLKEKNIDVDQLAGKSF